MSLLGNQPTTIGHLSNELLLRIFIKTKAIAKVAPSAWDEELREREPEIMTLGADPVIRAVCQKWKALADAHASALWSSAGLVCDRESDYLVTYRGFLRTRALCEAAISSSSWKPSITLFFASSLALANLNGKADGASRTNHCHDFPLENRRIQDIKIRAVAPYVKTLVVRTWSEYSSAYAYLTTRVSGASWDELETIDVRTRDIFFSGSHSAFEGSGSYPNEKAIWGAPKLRLITSDADEERWQGGARLCDVISTKAWSSVKAITTRALFYPLDIRCLLRHLSETLSELTCGVHFHEDGDPNLPATLVGLTGEVVSRGLKKFQIRGTSPAAQEDLSLNQLLMLGRLHLPNLRSLAVSVGCSAVPALDWLISEGPMLHISDLQLISGDQPPLSRVRSVMRALPGLQRFGFESKERATNDLLLEIVGNARPDGSPCDAGPPSTLREVHLYDIDSTKMSVEDMRVFMEVLAANCILQTPDDKFLLKVVSADSWTTDMNAPLRSANFALGGRASIFVEQVSGSNTDAPFGERSRLPYLHSESLLLF